MKFLLFILLFNSVKAQDYIDSFKTVGFEKFVVNYQIQVSQDSINWTTLTTIQPKKAKDSNLYGFTLQPISSYYRLKQLMLGGSFYSKPIKITNTNVSITVPVLKVQTSTDNLSFTASNEALVSYYSIERSINGSSSWYIVGKLIQTNKKNYIVNITKIGNNRKYRLIAYYTGGNKSAYSYFQ